MAKYRVYLKNKNAGDFEGFMKVKTIEVNSDEEEEAKIEAKKLETGGYKLYKIEKIT
ncbi:MAG: hypothetical protein ACTSYR_05745 [Candidatus Odinarchaeia archaeon]